MLYIIPAVYLCSGAPPSANGHDRPGSSTASQVYVWLLYKKKQDWKSVQNLNMDLISKSANRVCFWFVGTICGATPLLLHNISLLYVQTLSNNGATGPHYRFPLQPGSVSKKSAINVQLPQRGLICRLLVWSFVNIWTMCGHLSNVTPLYIWRN